MSEVPIKAGDRVRVKMTWKRKHTEVYIVHKVVGDSLVFQFGNNTVMSPADRFERIKE